MASEQGVVTKLREQLAAGKKDKFWAGKVAFTVGMKIALHSITDDRIKAVALTLLAQQTVEDLEGYYGSKGYDLKAFTDDCEQFTNRLLDDRNDG